MVRRCSRRDRYGGGGAGTAAAAGPGELSPHSVAPRTRTPALPPGSWGGAAGPSAPWRRRPLSPAEGARRRRFRRRSGALAELSGALAAVPGRERGRRRLLLIFAPPAAPPRCANPARGAPGAAPATRPPARARPRRRHRRAPATAAGCRAPGCVEVRPPRCRGSGWVWGSGGGGGHGSGGSRRAGEVAVCFWERSGWDSSARPAAGSPGRSHPAPPGRPGSRGGCGRVVAERRPLRETGEV